MMRIPLFFTLLLGVGSSELPPANSRQLQDDIITAIAYRCDKDNNEVRGRSPMQRVEVVRICLEPSQTAKTNIEILKINSFQFAKRDVVPSRLILQRAVQGGVAAEGGQSSIDCVPGQPVCVIETKLKDLFYEVDGWVNGTGSIAMQEGSGRMLEDVALRGSGDESVSRRTQQFVGMTNVQLRFQVEDGDKGTVYGDDPDRKNFGDHWQDSEPHMRGLYVTGFLVLVILLFCFLAGVILWRRCCADVPGEWLERRVRRDGKDEDQSETYSVDHDEMCSEDEDTDASSAKGKDLESYTSNRSPKPMREYHEEESQPGASFSGASTAHTGTAQIIPYDDKSEP